MADTLTNIKGEAWDLWNLTHCDCVNTFTLKVHDVYMFKYAMQVSVSYYSRLWCLIIYVSTHHECFYVNVLLQDMVSLTYLMIAPINMFRAIIQLRY